MKLLTAATGGVPGELVVPIVPCDTPGCPCGNDFLGVTSGQLVTVAVVADLEMDSGDLTAIAGNYLRARGWTIDDEIAADLADELMESGDWPEGTLIRRVGDALETV